MRPADVAQRLRHSTSAGSGPVFRQACEQPKTNRFVSNNRLGPVVPGSPFPGNHRPSNPVATGDAAARRIAALLVSRIVSFRIRLCVCPDPHPGLPPRSSSATSRFPEHTLAKPEVYDRLWALWGFESGDRTSAPQRDASPISPHCPGPIAQHSLLR